MPILERSKTFLTVWEEAWAPRRTPELRGEHTNLEQSQQYHSCPSPTSKWTGSLSNITLCEEYVWLFKKQWEVSAKHTNIVICVFSHKWNKYERLFSAFPVSMLYDQISSHANVGEATICMWTCVIKINSFPLKGRETSSSALLTG